MDRSLEIAAAASVGGFSKAREAHVSRIGQPCANCATILQGHYCHACGQLAEDFERSISSLVVEAFENLFHADGRLWRTLPALIRRPARLTRDYIEGKRASQVPPLRLFLVVIVVFFLAGNLKDALGAEPPPAALRVMTVDKDFKVEISDRDTGDSAFARWAKPRVEGAMKNPQALRASVESWLHRVAIAFLPISALILGLMFVFQRRFVLYDHAIFSMHSLSFLGLLATAATLLSIWSPLQGPASLMVMIAAPVHLFVHMRGAYRASVAGTLARMAVLGLLSAAALAALMTGVVLLGLNGMAQP